MTTKTVFVGLDGMEATLITRWADEGHLPAIASVLGRASSGVIEAAPGLGNDATWSTFNTGFNAGHTGRYFVRQVKPGTYESIKMVAADVNGRPFWDYATDAGLRSIVIDIPYAAISDPINGMQTADWLVHGPLYNHELHATPPSLEASLAAGYGLDPVGRSDHPGWRDLAANQQLLAGLIDKTAIKSAFVNHALEHEPWDLFAVAFTDGHCAGHQFWHIHDPAHPKHEVDVAATIGDPILESYRRIDRAVGEMLQRIPDDTTVVLFTGPGMGPNNTGSHILDDVLRRLEPDVAKPRRVMDPIRRLYRGVVPSQLRARLRDRADRLDERSQVASRSQRRCFAMPSNEIAGAIRVNLVGREPHGRVAPGADFDTLFAQLSEDLHQVVNAETGRPIVERVVRSDELFDGPYRDWLPDILVCWTQEEPVRAVRSPKIGEVHRAYPGNRTGDHTSRCLAAVAGPRIDPTPLDPQVQPLDLGVTIAASLGLDIPGADGHPIRQFDRGRTPLPRGG